LIAHASRAVFACELIGESYRPHVNLLGELGENIGGFCEKLLKRKT
jgi:hypothetical protein